MKCNIFPILSSQTRAESKNTKKLGQYKKKLKTKKLLNAREELIICEGNSQGDARERPAAGKNKRTRADFIEADAARLSELPLVKRKRHVERGLRKHLPEYLVRTIGVLGAS